PKNLINSFEIAKEPVFKNLPVYPSARLLTLLLTLKSPLLGPRISPAVLITAAIAVLAAAWWIYATHSPDQKAGIQVVEEKPDLAYVDFYAAMSSPAPTQQLNELAQTIQVFYGLPGWQARAIRSEGSRYHIQLERLGGSLQWLTRWAEQQN